MFKDKFFKNSAILTLSNSAMAILRFMFSVILSSALGAEGMGLYSLIMPVYDLFACIVCGGIVTAVSKEISAAMAERNYNKCNSTILITLMLLLLWSSFIAVVLIVVSTFLANNIINDYRALASLRILSPALVFIAITSVLKGYYYGVSEVLIPAIIDVFEKAARILFVIIFVKYIVCTDVELIVTIVYSALSIGEFISFILLFGFFYIKNKEHIRLQKNILVDNFNTFKSIIITAFPLCINGLLTTVMTMFSTVLLPDRLMSCGYTYKETLEMIGKFTGMAFNITSFTIVIIMSTSTILIPDISEKIALNNRDIISKRIKTVLLFSAMLGVSTVVLCLCIPSELGKMFYGRMDLGEYILYSSLTIPFIFVSATSYAIMSGLGLQKQVLYVSVYTSLLELIILYIISGISVINIYSYGISIAIASLVSIFINLRIIYLRYKFTFCIFELLLPVLFSILQFYIIKILSSSVKGIFYPLNYVLIIGVAYLCIFIFFKVLYIKK